MEVKKRYQILRVIGVVFKVFGFLLAISGIIGSTFVFAAESSTEPLGLSIAVFIVTLFCSILSAMFLYSFGELIKVIIDNEENTRIMVSQLSKLIKEKKENKQPDKTAN